MSHMLHEHRRGLALRPTTWLLVTAAALVSGCFLVDPAVCPSEPASAVRVAVHDADDGRVRPERLVISRSGGGVRTVDPTCPALPYTSAFEEPTTYTVRASCGSETVQRTVDVRADECGAITRQVKLVFPTGACTDCTDVGELPDTRADGRDVTEFDAAPPVDGRDARGGRDSRGPFDAF